MERHELFAHLIREVDDIGRPIEQRDIDDVRLEDVARLIPDELDHAVEFRLGDQRLADGIDRGEFGGALLALFEQALGFVEQPRVFEGNAHTLARV